MDVEKLIQLEESINELHNIKHLFQTELTNDNLDIQGKTDSDVKHTRKSTISNDLSPNSSNDVKTVTRPMERPDMTTQTILYDDDYYENMRSAIQIKPKEISNSHGKIKIFIKSKVEDDGRMTKGKENCHSLISSKYFLALPY